MGRPGFVLEVDRSTPPTLFHHGEGFKLEKLPVGSRIIYPSESLPTLKDPDAAIRHALRNSLIPVVTIVGLQLGAVLTGTIITETIFAWPGVGRLLIQSIAFRDYPLVQGCILLIAAAYVSVNLITDLLYGFLDPRIRFE